MDVDERIKLFAMSHQLVERALDGVEAAHQLELQRGPATGDQDEEYYPQFDEAVRRKAREMSSHYELFYCLEKSIRALVADKLEAEVGANWWDTAVPPHVKAEAEKRIEKEKDSAVTRRSVEEIDYTTFGELGEIVRGNWPAFSDAFNSEKAFTKVMTNLNTLRGPIAHCCPLAPDEVLRLRLTLTDWFRLMG